MSMKSDDILNSIVNKPAYLSHRNIDINRSENLGETISINEIYNLIKNKLTFLDPKTGKKWAINKNKKVEIDDVVQEYLSSGYSKAVKQVSIDLANENYDYRESPVISAALYLTEAFYSSFLDCPEFQKSKNNLLKIIKSAYDKGDEKKKKEIIEEILTFFISSKNNLPEIGAVKTQDGIKVVNVREQKKMQRAYFIGELMKNGIIDFDVLCDSNEILGFNMDQIEEVFRKQNLFTREELMKTILLQGFFTTEEQILDYYYYADRKYFFQLANSKDLAEFLVNGKFDTNPKNKKSERTLAVKKMQIREMGDFEPDLIEKLLSREDLPKNNFTFVRNGEAFISKDLMKILNREALLKVLYSQKIKFKSSLSSDELVNLYGRLNFADLEGLNQNKIVNSEDIIKIIKFYNIENKESIKTNLSNFYSLDKLEEMLKENRINKKFMENFNKFTNELLTQEEREEYFKQLKSDLVQKENKDELLITLGKKGFNFGKIEEYKMSKDKVSDMYLEEKITEQEIVDFYKTGVIPIQTIGEIFEIEDIKSFYREGKLDDSALILLKGEDSFFKEELKNGRLSIQSIMNLYSMENGLEIKSLNTILEGRDLTEIGIGNLLPDTISPQKVEILFKNYFISQDELSELVGRNIITKEQADKYAEELASHEAYNEIFNNSNVIILTKETEGEKGFYTPHQLNTTGNTGEVSRKNQTKIDPFLQEELLEKIGFEDRRFFKGNNNSLSDYIVYPSEKLGVVVFFNPNKPSNATYVMRVPQGMYFVKRSMMNNNKTTLESSATKQELRETENVKVKNACRGWGKNIIDTIKKLSPAMKEKLKADSEYKNNLEKIVREIGEDYDRRK